MLRVKIIICTSLFAALNVASAQAQSRPEASEPCRIEGFKNEVQCGLVKRALNPAKPQGTSIDVHYVVVPAVARNKLDDAVFFFAGGPGQGAIKLAPALLPVLTRLNTRRDVVFIDQRGTGLSAPLVCKPDAAERSASLADQMDDVKLAQRSARCRSELDTLPYGSKGGLSYFHTAIAMQDADAVRAALGYEQINIIGGSYGTRAGLEYMRQYPKHVRRAVLDGLAPPDMVLIDSFGQDNQHSLDLLLTACEKDAACSKRYPDLRKQFTALLASLPKAVSAMNAITGRMESFTLTAKAVASALRLPLYAPSFASALPYALAEASAGRFTPLMSMSTALSGAGDNMAMGMHFSVVCAEDYPHLTGAVIGNNAVFGDSFSNLYRDTCASWFGDNKPQVPEAFYTLPVAQSPTLLLSGGADPATPPRHGERVAKALGALARHVVAPELGHGVMTQGCARDMLTKFIDAKTDEQALKLDDNCIARLQKIPRAAVYLPPAFIANPHNKLANSNILKGVQ
jgi:pimeloyl-ACP methyl ester carboxylesterase